MEIIAEIQKPKDWPQNQREAKLSHVLDAISTFQKAPNYGNKEVLLSLISEMDPNQHDDFGLMRISEYEVAIINELYFYASAMYLGGLKLFLYKVVTETTRFFNIISKFPDKPKNINDIENYSGLISPLKLFHVAYSNFNFYKERTFCEEILDAVNNCEILEKEGKISLEEIEYAFVNLLLDLSYASGINTIPFIEFNKKELKKLFEKEFAIIRRGKKDPLERPLKGVLKMTISNWILRSRNNYNSHANTSRQIRSCLFSKK